MAKTVKVFRRKGLKGTVSVLANEGQFYVVADTVSGWSDWPAQFRGGLYWDAPGRIPQYVKALARQAFKWVDAQRQQ